MIGWGSIFQVPGLGSREPGTGVQVRVQVQENPGPEPGAEDLYLGPDGRDQRPENELAQALALISFSTKNLLFISDSGLRLGHGIFPESHVLGLLVACHLGALSHRVRDGLSECQG